MLIKTLTLVMRLIAKSQSHVTSLVFFDELAKWARRKDH